MRRFYFGFLGLCGMTMLYHLLQWPRYTDPERLWALMIIGVCLYALGFIVPKFPKP